jgi:hypothetical protein
VTGQLPVRRYRAGSPFPLGSFLPLLRHRAYCFDGPLRLQVGGVAAKLTPARVGGVREGGEVLAPLRVVDLGDPASVGDGDRVEGHRGRNPMVQHVGQLPGVVERPADDPLGERPLWVVAGQFGAAEQSGEGGAFVFGGERDPLVDGEVGRPNAPGTDPLT